ncbi:hypothetical protein Aam_128_004 [Acidocella aminolytica 101 = DSM 11237]|uniref:Uncharacterized protein n=1 Tax=Acidocella aminolytica 101 = DSM 11237 TaxID=1120923 RepID=A0A0D6PJK5_9PROT|nr:hypothetical protein Aam_128_004 [Acidocella aminolytica 101 = DSM 11237]
MIQDVKHTDEIERQRYTEVRTYELLRNSVLDRVQRDGDLSFEHEADLASVRQECRGSCGISRG